VYDVTGWVEKHPGGNLIGLGAGREATALVYSYHPLSIAEVLKKYYIGDVKEYSNYYTFNNSKFYSTLKARVHEHTSKLNLKRDSMSMYMKTLFLLCCWAVAYYNAFVRGSILGAVIFGFFHAELGINVMHDGNHGAYSSNKLVCKAASFVMDMMGSSHVVWRHQHNVGHHPNSNNTDAEKTPPSKMDPNAFDPDASAGNPFVRLNPHQNHRWHHRAQHVYMWFMIMVINFKWFINDLRAIVNRKYMDIEFGEAQTGEVMSLIVTKFLFLLYALAYPSYLHGLSLGSLLFVTFMISTGYVFVLMFGVNHLTEDCAFPDGTLAFDKRDWAALQVMTSSNFAIDSWFWTFVSGGLNFQIEHHLFPGLNHTHLPSISPIVRQTCKEFGVPYQSFPSFWAAVYSYYSHLKNLGDPDPTHTTSPAVAKAKTKKAQ
jgi:fatty acid desaturase